MGSATDPSVVPDVIDETVRNVKVRLWKELLYELQTGGGVSFTNELRGDRRTAEIQEQLAAIRTMVDELEALFLTAPARVAERLARPGQRVLDVGAGRAPWSLVLATRAPGSHVTAIDLPDQLPVLRDAVNAAGMAARFDLVGMDVFGPQWPTEAAYDVIVVANVCHLFDERRNRALLRRLAPLLHRDGTLAIIDQVLDEHPNWARWSALYVIGALHSAPGGRLFSVREYTEWLGEVGAWTVSSRAICPLPPLTLITARRSR